MKKFFSFVAALFFTGSMMAGTIYSWDGSQSANDSTANETGGVATAEGGNASMIVGKASKLNWCLNLGKGYSNGANYIKITLDSALVGGENITVGAYVTGNSAPTGVAVLGINFGGENELTLDYDAANVATSPMPYVSTNTAPADNYFTVPAAAAGKDEIWLYRKTGATTVFVSKFVVERDSLPADTITTDEAPVNLIDLSTTTFESWFGDGGWAPITTSTATYDPSTGAINCVLNQDPFGQWHAQLKLNTTGIVLDPAKKYEFRATFESTVNASGITFKAFDNAPLAYAENIAVTAGTPTYYVSPAFMGAGIGNGVIVFDLGNCPNGAEVTISDIILCESEADLIEPLAAVYDLQKNDEILLDAFDVVYVNGSNIYVKDNTAAGLLYASNYGLVAGDHVAAGLKGTIDIFNGIYEVKPTTAFADLQVSHGTAPDPAVATAVPTVEDQNKYVVYKGVSFDAADAFDSASKNTVKGVFKGDTITFYNNFKIAATFQAGKTYDVVAVNAVYKTNVQVYPIEVSEHILIFDDCVGEHGLFDPDVAAINGTYFAPGWNTGAGADHSAFIENGTISIHVGDQGYGDMWNGQVFVDPGFTFTPGKAYHYEFDIVSWNKVCITVKVNNSDDDAFFVQSLYDLNIGGGTYHFSTDSVFVNENLNTEKGPLVFGFGWTDPNQDIFIKCIKITEIGDAPAPVEEHMYIKHPWGTGVDADWSWQEMNACTFKNVDAWTYIGAWGGVGFNIADNAEGNNASWYAAADIQFLDDEQALVEAPAVGTANCEFYFIPSFVGGIVTPAYVVVPVTEGVENVMDFKASKAVVDGKLVIVKNGVVYNIVGARF